MKAYMKRAYSYYCNYSKQMDAAVTEYSRRTLEGPLRESAVARLLVEGKLPPEIQCPTATPSGENSGNNDPVDLSSKGRLQGALAALPIGAMGTNVTPSTSGKSSVLSPSPNGVTIDGHEPTVEVLQRSLRREMDKLKEARSEVPGNWKCRYCPYTAPTSKTLYSHYQFHQQLLASQSSRAHLEWLSAYRKAKENGLEDSGKDTMPFSYPPHPNLTYGVIEADKRIQPSASGFLKAIVKAVMEGKTTGEAVTSTSIYSTLTGDGDPNFTFGQTQGGTDSQTRLSPMASRRKKRKLEPHSAVPNAKDAKYDDSTNDGKKSVVNELVFHDAFDIRPKEDQQGTAEEEELSKSLTNANCKPEVLVSSVKESSASFSTSKSSYLDSLPLRKRPKDVYIDIGLTQCSSDVQSYNVSVEQHPESDNESTTTTATIQETLEKTGLSSQRLFCLGEEQDSLKSPVSVSSEIDVGSYGKCEQEIPPEKHITNHTNTLTEDIGEKAESTDSGHVASPLYRPCSSDSISSMDLGSTPRMSTQSAELTQRSFLMNGLECICEEDGVILHRGVQCDILLPTSFPADPTCHRSSSSFSSSSSSLSSSSSDSDCDFPGSHRSAKRKRRKVFKCFHCGISFEDEVLHSIHMGCHCHTDPYNCNVCGRSCGNRYGFYTHIMRGHLPE